MASYQYVYTMHKLTKAYTGGREVLKDINLSFMPGAKIGVLGLNGSGKSTLLRIMAGIETELTAKPGWPTAQRLGCCPRNRSLIRPKMSSETSWKAWAKATSC